MSKSKSYVCAFPDDQNASAARLREHADALEAILENEQTSPSGWSHSEMFAPFYLRQYARLLDTLEKLVGGSR